MFTPNISVLPSNVNKFAKEVHFSAIELTERQKFYLTLSSKKSLVYNLFRKNDRIVWFDAEGATSPTNYIALFETEFLPVLQRAGIKDIEIEQITEKIEEDFYKYEIYMKCKEGIYMYEYQEVATGWYEPQRLVKMLNMCLIDKKTLFRFVSIDTQDQSAMYFLIEPAKLKPFLDKHHINCWAIEYKDIFSEAK